MAKRQRGAEDVSTQKEPEQSPQAATAGDVFERGDTSEVKETSPATAEAVPAATPVAPPRGAVRCNACSSDQQTVWCTPVAPGWVQCPLCKVKQRNLMSLKAAQRARARGQRSRAAR